MLNYIKWLTEKQRYQTKTGYEELLPYKDDPNVYISYRDINKLGINPNNNFNTPIGIYGYSLKEIWKNIEEKQSSKNVPFGGDRPFIYIFNLKPEYKERFINNTDDYTKEEYNKDITKLIRYLNQHYMNSFESNDDLTVNDTITKYINKLADEARDKAWIKTPFGYLWYITMEVSLFLSQTPNNRTVIWNILFRRGMGYCGLADKTGKGVIHYIEPIQAVFFFKNCIEEIKMIRNI